MKKILFLICAVLVLSPVVADASRLFHAEDGNIHVEQAIDDTVFVGWGTVNLWWSVAGDIFAWGGTVTVNGDITDNAFLAGGNIRIDKMIWNDAFIAWWMIDVAWPVQWDLRISWWSISVRNSIGWDFNALWGQIYLASGASIGKDAVIFAWTIKLIGSIGRNVEITGKDIKLNGSISGNLKLHLANNATLSFWSGFSVGGTIEYRASNHYPEIERLMPWKVNYIRETVPSYDPHVLWRFMSFGFIINILSLWVFGSILFLFFQKFFTSTGHMILSQPWKSLLKGILFFVLLPIVSILTMMTVVGIPVGIAGLLFFGESILLAGIVTVAVWSSLLVEKTVWVKQNILSKLSITFIVSFTLSIIHIFWLIFIFLAFWAIISVLWNFRFQKEI